MQRNTRELLDDIHLCFDGLSSLTFTSHHLKVSGTACFGGDDRSWLPVITSCLFLGPSLPALSINGAQRNSEQKVSVGLQGFVFTRF